MTAVYHPAVQKDVNAILKYYEAIFPRLADDFWSELLRFIEMIEGNSGRSHSIDLGLQRVNLRRFPYHILFRQRSKDIQIVVVRHNKRHPKVGLHRL